MFRPCAARKCLSVAAETAAVALSGAVWGTDTGTRLEAKTA